MNGYFVIKCSEDGDVSFERLDAAELTKRLSQDYYGEDVEWSGSAPDPDSQYWGKRAVIIKGELVTPKPVDVVKRWEIP
jgi:hypothetical protein